MWIQLAFRRRIGGVETAEDFFDVSRLERLTSPCMAFASAFACSFGFLTAAALPFFAAFNPCRVVFLAIFPLY